MNRAGYGFLVVATALGWISGCGRQGFERVDTSCQGVSCGGNGVCAVKEGEARCVCFEGYIAEGLDCVEEIGACVGVECSGHGRCVLLRGDAYCDCDTGYENQGGVDCVSVVTACAWVECSGHGVCGVTSAGRAICACYPGYHNTDWLTCVPDPGSGTCAVDADCDDADQCTIDRCTALGDCRHEYHTGPCDDGLYCNGQDSCDGVGQCSVHAGDPCAPLACDEENDQCLGDPCSGHGTWSGGMCICDPGYAGAACDQCDPAYFGEYPYCYMPPAGYCDTSQCFLVPPTSQTACYDDFALITCTVFPCNPDGSPDFCGQDAQYPGNPRIFTCYDAGGAVLDPCGGSANEGEVVTDSLTGLMWQRTFAVDRTWEEALDYCSTLDYAGHSDWRLPSPLELRSIVDYGRYSPAIDTSVFPGMPPASFWSSLSVANLTVNAWFVAFINGGVRNLGKDNINYVRCVRLGYPLGTDTGERFAVFEPVAGEPVVYDAVTSLTWQKNSQTGDTWQQALSYCEGLIHGGHGDWRLPNINELTSLLDYGRYLPASDFPEMIPATLWSSSSSANLADIAWGIDLPDGNVYNYQKSAATNTRCVRSGP